jgi:hypothetical protein
MIFEPIKEAIHFIGDSFLGFKPLSLEGKKQLPYWNLMRKLDPKKPQ